MSTTSVNRVWATLKDKAAKPGALTARGLAAHEDGTAGTLSGTPTLTLGSVLRTVSRRFHDGPAPRQFCLGL